jgi:aspartate/glutamate racemase
LYEGSYGSPVRDVDALGAVLTKSFLGRCAMLFADKVDLWIIGGMSRLAGEAFQKVVESQGISTGLFSSPHPDRVAWVEGRGRSPADSLAGALCNALMLGEYCVLACNTAHLALGDALRVVPRWLTDRVIDMVGETLALVKGQGAVWFGTTVLAQSGALTDAAVPGEEEQEILQAAIWAAKKGEFPYSEEIRQIASRYNLIVAGCTEMPMILDAAGIEDYIDPAHVVANVVQNRLQRGAL